jgi:hypothetical protein
MQTYCILKNSINNKDAREYILVGARKRPTS